MTAHSSKGLEFDHVFILGCTEKYWERQSNALPYQLNKILEGEDSKAAEEENRRLFYVALTRARKGLHISYPLTDEKDKGQNKSLFLAEMESCNAVETANINVDASEFLEFFC